MSRVVAMATRAALRPAGKVTAVFTRDKERQGAYDLLETKHVTAEALVEASGEATARRVASESFIYVAVDGTSLTLSDRSKSKDFGSIGTLTAKARGLKVINALGISAGGVPQGLLSQVWWVRERLKKLPPTRRKQRDRNRPIVEKETGRWLTVVDESVARANSSGARLWFQIDREGDNRDMLLKLSKSEHLFTVRSSWNRLLETTGKDRQYLRGHLERRAPGGKYTLRIERGHQRVAREARIVVRWTKVTLRLRDRQQRHPLLLNVTAVWAREEGTCPSGAKPVDWLLLTNSPVTTLASAKAVLDGYTQRWRIEEMHKTWKSGACNVEATQLRTAHAVKVWATILAAVAVRIERLKLLARTTPDQPASVELSTHEIKALVLLKRREKKRHEMISADNLSIAQATLWIAELGGYTGKSSGGPPGSITIRRGLDRLLPASQALAELDRQPR